MGIERVKKSPPNFGWTLLDGFEHTAPVINELQNLFDRLLFTCCISLFNGVQQFMVFDGICKV